MIEVVEKSQPGIITMSKIQNKSSFYQENSSASSFTQGQAQPIASSSRADTKRCMESKFRMSPTITSFANQKYEDRNT